MCHGQFRDNWNPDQQGQHGPFGPRGPFGRGGPFWQQRGPFRPFWFAGGHGRWNSKYRESIDFNDELNQVEISIEVPGIPKDKIKVKGNNEFLYVSIDDRESDQDRLYERRFPFRLPADLANIKAKYNNGLLTIYIPLKESEKQDINID